MVMTGAVDQMFADATGAGAIPGVVALAANATGFLYSGALGRRDLNHGPAITVDTVFRIASMTKIVTCVAVLQLVEQGTLSLDQPVGGLLPELESPQVLIGFEEDGTPRLRQASRPITLRHLLTHTAGFGYHIWNADLNRYRAAGGGAGQTGKMALLDAPLLFDPGERWEYGINIDWAGEAVERASGLSLEDYLQEHIFRPLGMSDTSFLLTPARHARLAALHQRNDDGSLTPLPLDPPAPPVFYAGGGGLYSTGPDYLRFLQALLHGGVFAGQRILSAESVTLLLTNQIGNLQVGGLKSAAPATSRDGEFFPGMVKRWSLGGLLTTADLPGARRAGSLSWCGLYNCYFWLDPTHQLTALLLTQILPFLDPAVLSLADQFERSIYQL